MKATWMYAWVGGSVRMKGPDDYRAANSFNHAGTWLVKPYTCQQIAFQNRSEIWVFHIVLMVNSLLKTPQSIIAKIIEIKLSV